MLGVDGQRHALAPRVRVRVVDRGQAALLAPNDVVVPTTAVRDIRDDATQQVRAAGHR